jgi:3-hydroxyisobutyrate dehydrogenase
MAKVAFIGLGVMGAPIARHLAAAGHDVTVYNRTADKAAAWVAQHGGRTAATPAEAARDQDAVLTCVGNDDDLAAVTMGEQGALRVMRKGAVFIDHTTVSADIARRLANGAAQRDILAVDAPVSGGQAGAENGKLSIMCGGSPEAMALAEPLM